MAQREANHEYQDEPDSRPWISASTPRCRNGDSCRFLPDCRYSHGRYSYTVFLDALDAAQKRLRQTGVSLQVDGYKVRWGAALEPRALALTPAAPRRAVLQYSYTTEL